MIDSRRLVSGLITLCWVLLLAPLLIMIVQRLHPA